jgi:hypothetical protein
LNDIFERFIRHFQITQARGLPLDSIYAFPQKRSGKFGVSSELYFPGTEAIYVGEQGQSIRPKEKRNANVNCVVARNFRG